MKLFNREKGSLAERIAVDYLKNNYFKIIAQNFSDKWGEIDIIASKDKVLCFIEVKSKFSTDHGEPEGMINRSKIKKIESTAKIFLQKNRRIDKQHESYRVDVISIVMEKDNVSRLNFYENVGAEFS